MDDTLLAIGTEVKFKYMPMTGTITAYNTKPGIFGAEHFPYIVHRSDGIDKPAAEDDFTVVVLQIEHLKTEEVPNEPERTT